MKKLKDYVFGVVVLVGTMLFVGSLIGLLAGAVGGAAYLTFRLFV
jgi:hypothetical protein